MKKIAILFTLLLVTVFTSCITIDEIITFKNDGNGSFSQKLEYKELLEMMESMGAMSPDAGATGNMKHTIDSSLMVEIENFKKYKTLSNFKVDTTSKDYIMYSCDFKSPNDLILLKGNKQADAATKMAIEWSKKEFKFKNTGISDLLKSGSGAADMEQMKLIADQLKYNITYIFDKKISKCNVKSYNLTSDKKSAKLETNFADILKDPNLMNIEFKF
jgi:hypothetical protein